MTRAYVGLGANLGNPHRCFIDAHDALSAHPDVEVSVRSAIYRSAPVGPAGQADYLNAVLALDTPLDALPLLRLLQMLENDAGRRREVRWGPRTLDLDLLLFGDEVRSEEDLTLPHPRIAERNFVLQPLLDVAGADLRLPGLERLDELLARCPANALQRTPLTWEAPSSARGGSTP